MTRPVTSPKPITVLAVPGAVAVMVTSSPSSRKVRVLPSARLNYSEPLRLISVNETNSSGSDPLTVPDA